MSLTVLAIYKRKIVLWVLNASIIMWIYRLVQRTFDLILRFSKFNTFMTSLKSGTEQKKSSKSFYRKLISAILPDFKNWNQFFLTWPFSKLVINCTLKVIWNQLMNKIIYIANQCTLVLWRIILCIVKACTWMAFALTRDV